jgi:4-diphosphocytidyl-2-C-methyl-D-erythritol kinase
VPNIFSKAAPLGAQYRYRMIVFPNCKINIGLRVTGKRPDGYHNLETVFFPVGVTDVLEVLPLPTVPDGEVALTCSGLPVPGSSNQNLCVSAYQLLQTWVGSSLPGLGMHLHKVIPMGAGLGGGSSNGAFALRAINTVCNLGIADQQLAQLALQLGSDCPFFISNRPCLAKGRGELLTPLAVDLSGYHLLLVYPGIHVPTAQAFSATVPQLPATELANLVAAPVRQWSLVVENQFERSVFLAHPELAGIKERLYALGAVYAAMSGSGSTIFAISPAAIVAQWPAHYTTFSLQL